jgi:hypothetical protein
MSKSIEYLNECKNYIEEKYIYNLNYKQICYFNFLIGCLLSISYRLYHDGFSYNVLFPIWYVDSVTQLYDYLILALLIGVPLGFLIGTYIDNVKTRIFIKKYKTEPIKITYYETFKRNLKIMYIEIRYFLRLS